MRRELKWSVKEGKEIGHVKWYPSHWSTFFFLFFHHTLTICNKSHHSWVVITKVPAEEILFHFWLLSAALILHYFPMGFMSLSFFHTPFFFSGIHIEGLMPSNQLHFFWGKKKSQSKPMVYFIDKSIPPYFLQNLWNISAQRGSVCQLMKCQSSIMEK